MLRIIVCFLLCYFCVSAQHVFDLSFGCFLDAFITGDSFLQEPEVGPPNAGTSSLHRSLAALGAHFLGGLDEPRMFGAVRGLGGSLGDVVGDCSTERDRQCVCVCEISVLGHAIACAIPKAQTTPSLSKVKNVAQSEKVESNKPRQTSTTIAIIIILLLLFFFGGGGGGGGEVGTIPNEEMPLPVSWLRSEDLAILGSLGFYYLCCILIFTLYVNDK